MQEIKEYKVNVRVQGYDLSMDVKVPARDPDEAFELACGREFRYQDDDPYCLLVVNNEGESSVLCTYETLKEGTDHCEMITSGSWFLVKKDRDGGIVIKSSVDEEND